MESFYLPSIYLCLPDPEIRQLETLLFLILSILVYVCAMSGSQYTVWLSQLPWLGGAPGSYSYLEVKWGEESWGWGKETKEPQQCLSSTIAQCACALSSAQLGALPLLLPACLEGNCINSLLFPVKNPICSHFKPTSPNIAKGFGVHKMVLLILIVSLKYHILAVEF